MRITIEQDPGLAGATLASEVKSTLECFYKDRAHIVILQPAKSPEMYRAEQAEQCLEQEQGLAARMFRRFVAEPRSL